jgi:hypothetical protein
MNIKDVEDKIQLPPELQDAYERVVAAGMKVLFSKETHQFMLDQLQAPGGNAEKLGQGIAKVMVFLFNESNGSMPQEVLIPAAMLLLLKAADFVNQSKMATVTDEEIGQAMEIMIDSMFEGFGVDRSEFDAAMAQEMPA